MKKTLPEEHPDAETPEENTEEFIELYQDAIDKDADEIQLVEEMKREVRHRE